MTPSDQLTAHKSSLHVQHLVLSQQPLVLQEAMCLGCVCAQAMTVPPSNDSACHHWTLGLVLQQSCQASQPACTSSTSNSMEDHPAFPLRFLLITTCIHAGWVLANMIPFFYILKKLHLFRVSPEDEALGLDASYHGGSAYPGESEDVAFSWGPSPLERSNGKPAAAPDGDAGASVPTTNVILSKEAKAQQVCAWLLLLTQPKLMLLGAFCGPTHHGSIQSNDTANSGCQKPWYTMSNLLVR